jgi:tetratricopeptide (TPR) repeat protein
VGVDTLGIGQLSNDSLLAKNYINNARALLLESSKFDESIIEADKALQLLAPFSEQVPEKLGEAYHIKALALKKLSRTKEAEQEYLNSINLIEGLSDLKSQTSLASCLNDLADIYIRTNRQEEGSRLLKKSVKIRESIFPLYQQEVVNGRYNLAMFYFRNSKPLEARDILEQIITGFRGSPKPDSTKILINVYRIYGIIYGQIGNYPKALLMHQREVELSENLYSSSSMEYGHSINNLGVVYRHLRQYDKALDCYFKSLEIKLKNASDEKSANIAIAYGNIGVIYLEKEDYEEAVKYIEKTLNIYENIKDGDFAAEMAFQNDNLGIAFQGKKDYKSAIKRHQKALELLKNANEIHSLDAVIIYYNIGECYFRMGQIDSARQILNLSLNELKNLDASSGEYAEMVLNKLWELSLST